MRARIFPALLVCFPGLLAAAPCIAAQSPLNPTQAVTQVNQFAENLGPSLYNDAARLNDLAKKQMREIDSQYERAESQVDRADRAATEAFNKAKEIAGKEDCDPKLFETLRKRAETLMEQAQKTKQRADNLHSGEDGLGGLDFELKVRARRLELELFRHRDMVDKALRTTKEAATRDPALKDLVKSLDAAQQALEQEILKQQKQGSRDQGFSDEGSIERFNRVVDHYTKELAEAKKRGDQLDSRLKGIKERLEAAAKLLQDNCPPRVATAPRGAPPEEPIGDAIPAGGPVPGSGPGDGAGGAESVALKADCAVNGKSWEGCVDGPCVEKLQTQNKDLEGKDCGKYAKGTKKKVQLIGWWCASDEDWATRIVTPIFQALSEAEQTGSVPSFSLDTQAAGLSYQEYRNREQSSPAARAEALGLTQPSTVLTALGTKDELRRWQPCYNDEELKEIFATVDSAIRAAEAAAAGAKGQSGQVPQECTPGTPGCGLPTDKRTPVGANQKPPG